MKSSFERFRLYHIDQSLRIRFQDLAGNDLGLRAGNYTVEHGFSAPANTFPSPKFPLHCDAPLP